jgi:hypothetical protein
MAISKDSRTMNPNVGIRGNPQDLPTLNRSVGINANADTPAFGTALTAFATTPTALAEVGSQIMQASAHANAQRIGQGLGQKPQGNLLPAVTNFDKMVAESYTAQAHTTLGLQANQLLADGEEELSSLDRLTPEAIRTYTASMAQGLQDTIALAPDNLKPQMEAQYGSQLINSTHQFNLRMNSQQKAESASKDTAWRTQQSDAIQNAIKDGNTELAQQMQAALNQNINAGRAAGTLSPADAQTALTTAKLNFESSKSIKSWMDAKANGTSDEYLKSIANNKISGLSWSESEQVRDNTVKYASAEEAAENRNESLFMAQGQQEIAMGTFNQDRANFFRENLRPLQYTRLMTQWSVANHAGSEESLAIQSIVSNANDASAFIGATKKQINAVYDQLVNVGMQKAQVDGSPITQEDSQYQAAAFMATPVPAVIEGINRGLLNGNVQQVLNAIQMDERLHGLEGNKTIGVQDNARAVGEVFQNLLASNPNDPEKALQDARNVVLNKDENILKMNNVAIANYMQKHAPDAAHFLSNAVNISGLGGDGSNIDDAAAFAADINSRFKGYMQLTNGNVEQSKKLTGKDASKIWGETTVNGKKELTRLPIESIVHIPKGATPLIQNDIAEQLAPQLEWSKKAFDEGRNEYYLRVKEGRVSYDEYTKAKAEIEEKMSLGARIKSARTSGVLDEIETGESSFTVLRKSLASQRKIVDEFESGKPIEIEQVFRNKTMKSFTVNAQTSNWATISPTTGRVDGGINLFMVDPETGIRSALTGYYGSSKTQAHYSPDTAKIQARYLSVNGLTPKSFEQLERQYKMRQAALEGVLTANQAGVF